MGANSKIEWTHHTFNPWIGCTKVSEGCKNCYAEAMMDHHWKRAKWGDNGTRVRTRPAKWAEPLKWDKAAAAAGERHRVFCASLADVFENRPELWPWRDDLFRLILATPNLDWLLLTKRIENAHSMILDALAADNENTKWPDNIWIGTSVENQEQADKRIPELLKIPAKVRFLSMEPLLGPVNIRQYMPCPDGGDPLKCTNPVETCCLCDIDRKSNAAINWVIVGGESGRNARPMHPDWARSLRDQCQAAGVPFFFKQWGEWRHCDDMDEVMYHEACQKSAWQAGPGNGYSKVGKHAAGRLLDGRTWDEIPEVAP